MPGDEADPHGGIAGRIELLLDPIGAEIAGPQQPEPAGPRHGGGQPASGDRPHGGQQDRVSDVEKPGEFGREGHSPISRYATRQHPRPPPGDKRVMRIGGMQFRGVLLARPCY